MNDSRRLLTQGLLETARHDRPSAARRSHIWEKVSLATEIAVAAPLAVGAARSVSLAPAKAAVVGASAGKLLVVGAALGSVVTTGAFALLLRGPLRPAAPAVVHRASSPSTVSAPPRREVAPAGPAAEPVAPTAITELDEPTAGPATAATVEPAQRGAAPRTARRTARPKVEAEADVLMHEAATVSQARTALVVGNPTEALRLLDGIGGGASRSLEPEELALRARSLRLLGREAEAAQVEDALRARFPDSFLAR